MMKAQNQPGLQLSVTMNLKQSIYLPASHDLSPTDLPEDQYLQHLRETLLWVAGSAEANAREVSERYVRREEWEEMQEALEEKTAAVAALQSENYQLRVAAEQSQRYLRRHEMKLQLLTSKLYHLSKALAEKDAIIKYLEGKAAPAPEHRPRLNDSLHERNFTNPNLSFAKLKSTNSLMTFEDYANCSLQLPPDPTKRIRADRVRTESSDVKENECVDNIKPSKLTGFFKTSMFGSVENQRTLTKAQSTTAQQNASFWQYSKPQEGRQHRRHSNFSSTANFNTSNFSSACLAGAARQ